MLDNYQVQLSTHGILIPHLHKVLDNSPNKLGQTAIQKGIIPENFGLD